MTLFQKIKKAFATRKVLEKRLAEQKAFNAAAVERIEELEAVLEEVDIYIDESEGIYGFSSEYQTPWGEIALDSHVREALNRKLEKKLKNF